MNVECPHCKRVIEFCEFKGPDEAIRADERRKVLREAADVVWKGIAAHALECKVDKDVPLQLKKMYEQLKKMAGE